MRFRSTVVLALVLAALGAYVYFVEFERAAEEQKKQTLLPFKEDDVTEVKLTYPDREIEVKRVDGKWRLVRPLQTAADETSVKNLLQAISGAEIKKTLEDVPADLAPYGLAEPAVVVQVTLTSGPLPALHVGKTTPVGFSTYVQRADKPEIYLTGSAFHSGMDKKVKDLRDKQILTFDEGAVTAITVRGEDRDILLSKGENGWTIEHPGPFAADATAAKSFVTSLRNLRATDFPTDAPQNLADYGLDDPRLTIGVSVGEGTPTELLVGQEQEDKKLYVKVADRPTIYEVGTWAYRDLDKGVDALRNKTILAFERDDATEVELQRRDGEPLVLQRDESGAWTIPDETARPTASTVDGLLGVLSGLKGYEIAADAPADLAPYGLDAPILTVVVRGKEGEIGRAIFGSYPSDGKTEYAAMREGEPTVFRVRDYTFKQIDKQKADFLPKPTATATPSAPTPTAAPAS